jgi:hypothetical protein
MPVNTSVFRGRDQETRGTKTGVTGGTTTLTVAEAMPKNLVLQGAVATDSKVVFPVTAEDAGLIWFIDNQTTNGGSSVVKIAGPGPTTGVAVAQAKSSIVVWTGSEFELAVDTIT